MPRRQLVFSPDHFYHVYNRGMNRAQVFFSDRNYIYFLQLLKRNAERYGIAVTAYCLMPNHYHLLVRPSSSDSIPKLIKSVAGSYVQAVNREQDRQGSLFQARFRAVWVGREDYLVHLATYIHMNPVEAGLVSSPERWQYSNYRDLIGLRQGTLRDETLVPGVFESGEAYRSFVEDGLAARRTFEALDGYRLD